MHDEPTFPGDHPDAYRTLRCHWVETTDGAEHGFGPRILVPGCVSRLDDPTGPCDCDTLARKHASVVYQLKDQASIVGFLRQQARNWRAAAGEAAAALRGRDEFTIPCSDPQSLVAATRHYRRTHVTPEPPRSHTTSEGAQR